MRLQSPITNPSRCDRCGFEASPDYLNGGMCEPCRTWKWSDGPCHGNVKRPKPPTPKVVRTITVRSALARARATYGHVPRFIVSIIRANTQRAGALERLPLTKLPHKLWGERGKRNPVFDRNR